jgi:hypothetical protein
MLGGPPLPTSQAGIVVGAGEPITVLDDGDA